MKKLGISLLCMSALVFAQPQINETKPADQFWAGITTGFPLGAIFHVGIRNAIGPVSLRASTSAGLGGPFDLAMSGLIDLPVTIADWPTRVYAGLGPTFTVGKDVSALNAQGFLGIEYRLGGGNEPGAFFVELGPVVEFIPEIDSSFVWKVGFNYYFGF
jgi:hypothetical protein